jgi:hypothetical protein
VAPYRAAIEDAFAFASFDGFGFVHYRDAWAWRDEVEAVLADLDALLESGSRRRSSTSPSWRWTN